MFLADVYVPARVSCGCELPCQWTSSAVISLDSQLKQDTKFNKMRLQQQQRYISLQEVHIIEPLSWASNISFTSTRGIMLFLYI